MKIIEFEEAKAKIHSKEKSTKHFMTPEVGDDALELKKQYQELAQFYNHWYDNHVVGQDENGRWIYKDQ